MRTTMGQLRETVRSIVKEDIADSDLSVRYVALSPLSDSVKHALDTLLDEVANELYDHARDDKDVWDAVEKLESEVKRAIKNAKKI